MHSFKFYYLEACDCLKIEVNEKLLAKIEESENKTNLNLSTIELPNDTCTVIGHALRKDVFLKELDLSNCMLSDDGLSSILSGLEINKFLLTLNLKGNNIRSAGTIAIGKLLRHNNHLQNLYLEWNGTGILPEKFSYLCEGLCMNTSLKALDLRNNQLNHLCAKSVADVINKNSTLEILDLRWNSIGLIGGRAILKYLAQNKSIFKLDITGNDVPLEIQKYIELLTSGNAERYIKNSENRERTKFFVSKFQRIEKEQEKRYRELLEQLERKDKDLESSQKWNSSKLFQLQEIIMEKDQVIEDSIKKSKELEREIKHITEERNEIALTLNEMEIKNKELKKEFQFSLDQERKERKEIEKKLVEEIGTLKEENLNLKQKIQDLNITQNSLDDQAVKLKNTIAKLEKKAKLEKESFQEQFSALKERHQENLKQLDYLKKSEISGIKEEFSEVEKHLRQRMAILENRRNDLEKQIIEKDASIIENKAQAEKMVDELKRKKKSDEEKLRKQMEEQIEFLESANKEKEVLLKEHLQTLYEIKRKCTENDILLAKEAHHTKELQHLLDGKDAEMHASIEKVKLEVKDKLEELKQVKTSLEDSLTENVSLKQQISAIEEQHKEEIQSKGKEIKKLKKEIEKQKAKVKEILENENKRKNDLQMALTSYISSAKLETYNEIDSEDELNMNK